MDRDYYLKLYSKESCTPSFLTDWTFPELDDQEVLCLNRDVSPF